MRYTQKIDIIIPTDKPLMRLMKLNLSAGVDVEIALGERTGVMRSGISKYF